MTSTKKRKLRTPKTIKRWLWELHSQFVRRSAADSNGYCKCVTCKVTKHWKEMDCGHYKPNTERSQSFGGNALWYDLRNFAPQCNGCNRINSGRREVFAIYVGEKHGYGTLKELERLYHTPKKWSREEIDALADFYKKALDTLNTIS